MMFCQEVAYKDCSMWAYLVMQQTPLSAPVHLWVNTWNVQQSMLQNIFVGFSIDSLLLRDKFLVDHGVAVLKTQSCVSWFWFSVTLLGAWETCWASFHCLPFRLLIMLVASVLISYDFTERLNLCQIYQWNFEQCVFALPSACWQHKTGTDLVLPKSWWMMCYHCTCWFPIHLISFVTVCSCLTASAVILFEGRLECGLSSMDSFLSCIRSNQLYTLFFVAHCIVSIYLEKHSMCFSDCFSQFVAKFNVYPLLHFDMICKYSSIYRSAAHGRLFCLGFLLCIGVHF